MKICSHCKTEKPLTEYYRHKNTKDGLGYVCKDCRRQYRRDYAALGIVKPGAEERFWSRVEKTDGCWFWRGGITTEGYGRFFHGGKDVPAHHMPMIFAGCEPPRYPMVCDHLCRVRHCVRWPDHVEVVTQGENTYRGVSPFARNKAKTECIRGHPFDEVNTQWIERDGKPARQCRACANNRPSDLKRRASANKESR
jgi:hypothetical protein